MSNQATRRQPLTKGQFILYDKLSNQAFPNCIWTFLYNPEQLVNETKANVNAVQFAGQNWPVHYTNGIEEETYTMTLALTGDNSETKNTTYPSYTSYEQRMTGMVGETTIRVTPAVSSSVGQNPAVDTPNLFSAFGKKNMVYHIEHLKSLMLKDPGYEWRVLFNYGNIVPGGMSGYPNVFILNSLSASHLYCSADLTATILATVEVELTVDTNTPITRTQYLSIFRERQKLGG